MSEGTVRRRRESSVGEAVSTKEYFVSNGAARIHITECGKGPTAVLVPSLGRGTEDFADLASSLVTAGFRVLLPRPRGIFPSTGPLRDLSLHDLSQDVSRVVEEHGDGRVFMIGHAFGNWIARMVATTHTRLVGAVVLLAASYRHMPADVIVSTNRSLDTSLADEERLQHLQIAYFAPGNDAAPWLAGWHPELARAQRAAGKLVSKDVWWGAGGLPILDLQAEDDAVAPAAGSQLLRQELGDRVTVVRIAGAGHALLPEQPAAVSAAVVAYLQQRVAVDG